MRKGQGIENDSCTDTTDVELPCKKTNFLNCVPNELTFIFFPYE